MPEEEVEKGMHAGRAEFDAIVQPLERAVGRRLNGAGREKCWRAFKEASDGFRALAEDALGRARNPLGLLIRMVEAGEHRLADEAFAARASRLISDTPSPKQDQLERALEWALQSGRAFAPEDRAVVLLDNFGLTDDEIARVQATMGAAA